MRSVHKPGLAQGYLAVIAAAMLWGFSFFFGKVALRELTSVQVVLGRFMLATLVLVPVISKSRGVIQRRHWPLVLMTALLMVPVTFLVQFEGLARTSATHAALIIGAFPPIQALLAFVINRERPGPATWCAIGLSSIGVYLMVGRGGGEADHLGDLMILFSIATSAVSVLLTQRLLQFYGSRVVTAYCMGLGTLLLFPPSLIIGSLPAQLPSPLTLGAVTALGLLCTLGTYSLWNWGLAVVPAANAGVIINLEPLMGALLGTFVLGEAASVGTLVGGLIVLAAAFLPGIDHLRGRRRIEEAPQAVFREAA